MINIADQLKALSDETRLRIVNLLYDKELCVCDILKVLDITQTKASRHLAYLKNNGFVKDRKEAQWSHYTLIKKENELLKLLCQHRNDFMPRDLALRKIWKKENYFTARSMDVYIAKLRKLLREDDGLEIINVHGEGFRLLVKN